MLFSFIQDGFVKSLFREPDKSKYSVSNDLAIETELIWSSHKEDSKNLKNDYKNIRMDVSKAFEEYKAQRNG
jgi:hypothetical protein